jgi:hypothetical protein
VNLWRKLVLGLVALVLALAPAVAAAAHSSPDPRDAASSAKSANAAGVREHCHKPAPQPAQDETPSCKHCSGDQDCKRDLCPVKCFKVVADLVAAPRGLSGSSPVVAPPVTREPQGRAPLPPAPPPRA